MTKQLSTPAPVLIPCPSCSSEQDAASDCCSSCGWQFQRKAPLPAIVGGLSRPKNPIMLDLAVTVDRTASSTRFETGIPEAFEHIVKETAAQVAGMRIYLYSHGDFDEGQDIILHTDGGSPEQALNDIKSIPFGGGGDPHEHHLDAIEHLMNHVPWAKESDTNRPAIVFFGTQDSKPCRSGKSAKELGEEIKSMRIKLYLVCEPTYTLYSLAKAADALIFRISNSSTATELQAIASSLAASMSQPLDDDDTKPMSVNN